MFITVKLKKSLFRLTLFILVIMCSVGLSYTESAQVFFGKSSRRVPVYAVDTEEKVVALSFDAAYGADKTEGIMDVLEENGVSATFFLVGFWVTKYPEKVRSIHERGFEIGTHGNVHGYMSKMSESEIRTDISQSIQKIKACCDAEVRLFRPPYGDYDDLLVDTATDMGLIPIQWSIDSLDWKNVSAGAILDRVLPRLHNGAIILCHNNSDYILEALPKLVSGIKSAGYEIKSVGDVVLKENYYIDNNGVQHRRSKGV